MRTLLISDIHANFIALEAVLAAAEGEWDQVWFLGDLIGYGPQPNECVERLRVLAPPVALSGNHDLAVLGKLDTDDFNSDARQAVNWTRRKLTGENRNWLAELPPLRVEAPFTLAHASPRHPVWEYILDLPTALENFAHFETRLCLVGHSHVQMAFVLDEEAGELDYFLLNHEDVIDLSRHRLILNPGSVGQPRDGDPRAAFALLDDEALTAEFRRVEYDIAATQALMRGFNAPKRLIKRLEQGM